MVNWWLDERFGFLCHSYAIPEGLKWFFFLPNDLLKECIDLYSYNKIPKFLNSNIFGLLEKNYMKFYAEKFKTDLVEWKMVVKQTYWLNLGYSLFIALYLSIQKRGIMNFTDCNNIEFNNQKTVSKVIFIILHLTN